MGDVRTRMATLAGEEGASLWVTARSTRARGKWNDGEGYGDTVWQDSISIRGERAEEEEDSLGSKRETTGCTESRVEKRSEYQTGKQERMGKRKIDGQR